LPSDRAEVAVGRGGCLEETGEACEPYRLIDPGGMPVEAAAAYFRDLQAAGRSVATVRSYGLDLLRWFRFLRAIGISRDQATWKATPGNNAKIIAGCPEQQDQHQNSHRGLRLSAQIAAHPGTFRALGAGVTAATAEGPSGEWRAQMGGPRYPT
jgi:hypothetical protein